MGSPRRKRRASLTFLMETLENRLLLSGNIDPPSVKQVSPLTMAPLASTGMTQYELEQIDSRYGTPGSGNASSSTGLPGELPSTPIKPVESRDAKPGFILAHAPDAAGASGANPAQFSSAIYGYSPHQIESAYGLNNIFFGAIKGDGAGQTVAIVDAYDNTAFLQTSDPNFTNPSLSALYYYDQYWGLPNTGFTFTKYNEYGVPGGTGVNSYYNWSIEIALDIEAVHSVAPDANIDLVEATSASFSDLMQAAQTAAELPGVSAVSMSFGADLEYFGEGSYESYLDNTYLVPALAYNPNVTFLASTGDNGGYYGVEYPSASPLVVAVGGTDLTENRAGQWTNETGWSFSTGGISNWYSEPVWQDPFQSTGQRTTPDVSADANPNTGLAVYDPFDFGESTPWDEVGGTSLATPLTAGMVAIADQGRATLGAPPLDGPNQTLPALYGLASSPPVYSANYVDVTVGSNGPYSAGPGYDLVTGLGSPKADTLLPNLSAYGLASKLTVATEPPSTVTPGGEFGIIALATDSLGDLDASASGTALLTLKSGPAGASFTPVDVPMTDGLAVFDGISLSQLSSGAPYVLEASLASSSLTPAATTDIDVVSPTAGVNYYYPMPLYSLPNNLYTAIDASNSAGGTNIIELSQSTFPYDASHGALYVANESSAPDYSLLIYGTGSTSSIIDASSANGVIDINGNVNTWVTLESLSIEQGEADSSGGGLSIDGGNVALTGVMVADNQVIGANGSDGDRGDSAHASHPTGGPGTPGGNGQSAYGGGIFLGGGSLTLKSVTISGNLAQGGAGGYGGTGGFGFAIALEHAHYTTFSGSVISYSYYATTFDSGNGGSGGVGGAGGAGAGGGVYVGGGSLSITQTVFDSNAAVGGAGGEGGFGGPAARRGDYLAGNAATGGAGGSGAGGALYIASGNNVPIVWSDIKNNVAAGGTGGRGGLGGSGAFGTDRSYAGFTTGTTGLYGHGNPGRNGRSGGPGYAGGNGGDGGNGGAGAGGGIYLGYGSVSLTGGWIANNDAIGGAGGGGGEAGFGGFGGGGSFAGTGAPAPTHSSTSDRGRRAAAGPAARAAWAATAATAARPAMQAAEAPAAAASAAAFL